MDRFAECFSPLSILIAGTLAGQRTVRKLIGAVALKNATSRFAMEKIKSVTALPVPAYV